MNTCGLKMSEGILTTTSVLELSSPSRRSWHRAGAVPPPSGGATLPPPSSSRTSSSSALRQQEEECPEGGPGRGFSVLVTYVDAVAVDPVSCSGPGASRRT